MKKSRIRILSIILAFVLVGGALVLYRLGIFSPKQPELPTTGAQPAAMRGFEVIPVKAIVIRTGALQDAINVNGSTVANEEVMIASEVQGKITKIAFQEGTMVRRGTPLVQLDVDELKAQRERLLVRQQLTRKIAERLEGLYKKEGVSLQEYEIARAEADQVDAELALIDVQITKRLVRAPFDGILGLRQVSEGSFVSAGTPIVSLVNTNPIMIEFAVPERYSSSISSGTRINFLMDGTPERFTATVVAKDPNIDLTTRTLKLKASAPNPNGKILPGAFANVRVNLQSFSNAIMIPTQAIMPEMGGKKVYVYRDGKAEAVDIETGIRQEDMIQVTKGLQNGDTIITTGILQLRPGAAVRITEVN
jgi:membrane fusion protein (multidrug efflux system)